MNAVVDFPDVRYAVIEGLQTEAGREHIIIAYANEKSLRDLFAAPSIVAVGFATRHEAVVAGRPSLPTAIADQRKQWQPQKLTDPSRDLIGQSGQSREERQVPFCGDLEGFSLPPAVTLSPRPSSSSLLATRSRRQSGWRWAVPSKFRALTDRSASLQAYCRRHAHHQARTHA